MFTNLYISYIVSNNSSQTLKFAYLVILLNTYAPQIWPQPCFCINMIKYEFAGAMQKKILFTIQLKNTRHMRNGTKRAINIQTNIII